MKARRPRIRWPRRASVQVPRAYIRRGYIPTYGADVITRLEADIAGTRPERIVAGWLDAHGIPYNFQLPIAGGRLTAGGIVVDFLILVPPVPIALWVNSWWHRAPERRELDAVQQDIIKQNVGYRVEEIWEEEILNWRTLDARMREIILGWRPETTAPAQPLRAPGIPPCCDDEGHWVWYYGL